MSSSSSQDIIKDLDVPSPAVEFSTHSSSDEDSSSKQDEHQMLEASSDSSVPNAPLHVLQEKPLGEELSYPSLVAIKPIEFESLIVEDQKHDEESPAISFDDFTPMLPCQVTSDLLAPSTVELLISSDVELVKT